VSITRVEVETPARGLLGARIDEPVPGALNSFALPIRGWAIGEDEAVAEIEVSLGSRSTTLTATLGEPRPDLTEQFAGVSHAGSSGFSTVVGLLENRASFTLEVHARLSDGRRIRIARIEGERRPISTGLTPAMQPLMLNTIGRSGSTWLAWLLSCHPEVVGYRPMRFETRVATYWTSVLQGLAQPRSYLSQLVATDLESDRRWWLGDGARSTPKIEDPPFERWLGGDAVEQVAALCQSRIDAFFQQLAVEMGKPHARFFLEKFLSEPVVLDLLGELYGHTREIILVRDFRDVASSILAFNRKRGFQAFGREQVDNDAEYIRSVALEQALGLLHRWEERRGQAHLVRYEDLLTEPDATLASIFEFVGVDSAHDVVKQALERARNDAPSMDHHRTAADPTATIGRWRDDLPAALVAACADSLDPVLEAFGYEPTRASATPVLGV
jgi:hypothetical protein